MDDIIKRLDKMSEAIAPYAEAHAKRVYIEAYLKSKRALLMQAAPSDCETVSAKENYAYSHADYLQLLDGLKAAVEIEEKSRWALEHFKIQFEFWRTTEANNRWAKDRI
jgi:hypothetical protein